MSEDHKFYLPILKSKAGELKALIKLNAFVRARILPLLEITPMEWDHTFKTKPREMPEHLSKFCKKVLDSWGLSAALIDTSLIEDKVIGESSCMEYIFDKFHSKSLYPIKAMPVFAVTTPQNTLLGIKNIATKYPISQAGLRVNLDALTNPTFKSSLDLALDKTGFTPDTIHLVLDLKDSNLSQTEDYSDAILAALEDFPYLHQWRTFTICGSAFPSSKLIHKDENIIPRYDWSLFEAINRKIQQEEFSRKLNYGDYGIVNPEYFEFDPTKMSSSANIKYTIDKDWLVIKGNSIKKSGNAQYFAQAKEIAGSTHFLGKTFSEGDLYIYNCAQGRENAGNPNTWNWVANNHHFTKVVTDLFAIPPVS
jgi:hypothetical protein